MSRDTHDDTGPHHFSPAPDGNCSWCSYPASDPIHTDCKPKDDRKETVTIEFTKDEHVMMIFALGYADGAAARSDERQLSAIFRELLKVLKPKP